MIRQHPLARALFGALLIIGVIVALVHSQSIVAEGNTTTTTTTTP